MPKLPPVRLCCGKRHYGPVCPDGKVMCCVCFERFSIRDLATDERTGIKSDLCHNCNQHMKAIGEEYAKSS